MLNLKLSDLGKQLTVCLLWSHEHGDRRGACGLNLGQHACAATTLPDELSPDFLKVDFFPPLVVFTGYMYVHYMC